MTRAPRPAVQALVVVAVLVLAELPIAWHYLVTWPGDQWQVDVEVYREAARSVVYGRPIYEQLTESPQLLPFTYPPFAALVSLPMTLVSFHALGWIWTGMQVAATYATVMIAFRRLLARVEPWRWVAGALVTVPMLYLLPVSDGVRFGQVNAFLVLACLGDLALPLGPWHRVRGIWIGLATAIKLTPGVFFVHFAVCRRWRELAAGVLAAATATVAAALVLPEATVAFWGGALGDPNRLGPNRGTSNQSLRGVLLRLGPEGAAGTALWLLAVLVVGVIGFTLARRAYRAGDPIAEVAAVGLMAVLLSPVAWVHHYAWVVLVIAALVGDGRDRRRLVFAGIITAWFLARLPWWGISWVANDWPVLWFGRILQNSYCLGGLLALALLWRVVPSPGAAGRVAQDVRDSEQDMPLGH
ncbi:glycosyltransferase 87 family protein [Angustibacter luteus]|uniref:Glycosyltransferase 87 family protein n=1 Tax=Angustibacter luteus TaxID=658456 RepID=A0ABW1JDA0_9ACTN